jgi:hypothetical protein
MARRLPGDRVIDDTQKIAAARKHAKHVLEETLDPRCIAGKHLERLLLRLATLLEFDADNPPSFRGPQPIFIPVFDGDEDYRPAVYDDLKAEAVIELARRGDADAGAVLCEIAATFTKERRYIMPSALLTYIVERAGSSAEEVRAKPRPRGRKVHTNLRRNIAIVNAITELLGRGFYATRNDDTERECACSIVAEALKDFGIEVTYPAVAKIWAEYAYLTKAQYLARLIDFRWKEIPGFSFL